ncbi:MAG: isomerizing glutamine--fructose-6-phosphate transaminase, partial [Christensenellales bacterium]
VWKAFKTAICKLKGSFAIVMINSIDNNIYFARLHSPMVIGRKGDCYSIASDKNGLEDVDEIAYLNNESIGYIDKQINVYDKKFKKIKIDFCENSIAKGRVSKGEYSHFMLKEIFEIPSVLKETFNSITNAKFTLPKDIKNVLMVSCGTSYHSSLIGKKYIESLAKIPVECEIASEYIYNEHINLPNTLGIFISQSGETADTLSALKRAKSENIFTLAITNVENSSITKLADAVLYLNVGAEICVASTKAYTSQVFSLLLLTNILINNKNDRYVKNEFDKGLNSIEPNRTIDYLGLSENDYNKLYNIDISKLECEVNKVACEIWTKQEMHLIGKDYDYITAMEGSLKIKEVSYIFTDAYPCGELKHGTLSLIDDNSIVIAITTNLQIWDKVRNSINEIISRGGKVIGITQFNMEYNGFYSKILIPELSYLLMPIVSIIPIDLLAYKISILRGVNPDKPRNLAKSVTVE